MAFFALTEGALAAGYCVRIYAINTEKGGGRTYAALFWALRRLCAGVRLSFSSLLLRVRLPRPSSNSAPMPESTLPTGMGVCAATLSGEPCWGVGRPLLKPNDAAS